ncbi:MAG: HEAT repeat domain-containing protein [Candidatus Eremiobacterota bacterium]
MKKLTYFLLTAIMLITFTSDAFSARTNADKFIKDLGSSDVEKIKIAQEQLILLGKDGIPDLLKALENENTQIRGYVAVTLGMMKAKDAVDQLILSLKDSSSSVRVSAIWALGEIRDDRAIKPVEDIYKNSSGLEKLSSAVSLIHLGQPEKITVLIEFLMNENGYVRRTAANALGELRGEPQGDYDGVKKLVDTMVKPGTGEEDIKTAGKMLLEKKLRALYPLIELLNDSNEEKRAVAALYLGQLDNEISIIPIGITLKRDISPYVRSGAAQALKKINDARALPYLKDALKKETDGKAKAAIEDAIKKIKK